MLRERMMTELPSYLSDSAQVDSAAVKPLPNSRKVYVTGSRPDLRVPMREISLADTATEMGGEKNAPNMRTPSLLGNIFRSSFRHPPNVRTLLGAPYCPPAGPS